MTKPSVVIAGGGPAGMLAGLLFARAAVPVTVLEKHTDFLRDFRGDTVHPSTLEIFHQLGMLTDLLELPHTKVAEVSVRMAGREMKVARFDGLKLAAPYIAMMPQWDLLDFIASKASVYPEFNLRMGSEVADISKNPDGTVNGVRLKSGEALPADLVIAADGRRSILRKRAKLPLEEIGAPMDVFWFRIDKRNVASSTGSFGTLAAGKFLVLIERQDYFQCAFVLEKGRAEAVRTEGIGRFRQDLRALVPELSDSITALQDWDQVKLLDVALDRLTQWHRPGFLAIGDAAHAMSPIGGVGINVALQDAVAAANILAAPLASNEEITPLLPNIQKSRWRAVTRMQWVQKIAQDRVIAPVLARTTPINKPFFATRLLNRSKMLRRLPGRIIGAGFDRVSVESPNAHIK